MEIGIDSEGDRTMTDEREYHTCGDNIEDLEDGDVLDEAAYTEHLCVLDYREQYPICDRCDDAPAKGQTCRGDGQYHYHGGVHDVDGTLLRVCDNCGSQIEDEWAERKLASA